MPDFNFHVISCRCDHTIFFIESDRWDKMIMCVLYFFLLFTKVQIPYSYWFIIWCGIEIFSCWVDGDLSYPVVMTYKSSQMFASLANKQFYHLVSSSCKQKCLLVWAHSVQPLFSQLFESVYFTLLCKFRLQKLRFHQLLTLLTFNKKQSFNDIIMCKVTIYRSLFINLPNTDTLIIRATRHDFAVCWNNDISDPFLMSVICTSVESCANLPKFNRFISWARN